MSKLTFEQLALEANKLTEKMAEALSKNNLEEADYYQALYDSLLEGSGWDQVSFDKEMLKRIDAGWIPPNKKQN